MLLRKRLTLINTTLVGGILLVLGAVVYQIVSLSLVFQVDRQLADTAQRTIQQIPRTEAGDFNAALVNDVNLDPQYAIQFWNRDKHLLRAAGNLEQVSPLSVVAFGREQPIFLREDIQGEPFRVLSVPLVVGKRPVGTLMVGTNISRVDLIQRSLLNILFLGVLVAVGLVGLAVWLSTRRALTPLEDVSRTAQQITRAGDLALRIPYHGPKHDEVGQLIQSFNKTLERMEDVFDTQKQFLSDVSHELRTPLTVIKGNVELLQRMDCVEEEEEEVKTIQREVNRMTRMVQDLLLLAQAESGRLPMDYREVSLDTLLLETYQQAEMLAGDDVEVVLEDIDQVMVRGDGDRLKQVMINLISNAIKYTPSGGTVRLALEKVDGRAQIMVQDTGPGIPEDELPHIFKRFYRTEKSRTRTEESGVGLGLSIVYWIVKNHEGDIEVESELGEGTTFRVYLPALRETA